MLQPRPICRIASRVCLQPSKPPEFHRPYASITKSIRSRPTDPPLPLADNVSKSKLHEQQHKIFKTYSPRTPGLRHLKRVINDHLWKGKPFRPLTYPKRGQARGGRNNTGRITVRHRGGGHKRRIRMVDFMRNEPGPQKVERIEYDPNRGAHLALLTHQQSGRKSYIVAAEGMRAGDVVESFRAGIPRELINSMGGVIDLGLLANKTALRGNCLPLKLIPAGMQVYNVGMRKGGPAVFCRAAGTYATIMGKDQTKGSESPHQYTLVRLQSQEVRRIPKDACATIGTTSNPHFHFRQLGKAGRARWLGIRPTVRGLAMNRVDHPHGGGRGKSKSNRIPTSPWGIPAKSGYKTRKKSKSTKHVFTPRPRNQGRRRNKGSKAKGT